MLSDKRHSSGKKRSHSHRPTVIGHYKVLTRVKALRQIKKILCSRHMLTGQVLELMTLFHFRAEELTEAGIPYEVVRALEKHHPLLFSP